MTIYMYIASTAWLFLLAGYALRRRRWLHVPLALTGITLDLMLVAYLQLTRSAVQTAMSFSLGVMEQIHIANSSIALLLYFPILYLGGRLILGRATLRQRTWHLRLATAALLFRSVGFFFMLSLIK